MRSGLFQHRLLKDSSAATRHDEKGGEGRPSSFEDSERKRELVKEIEKAVAEAFEKRKKELKKDK